MIEILSPDDAVQYCAIVLSEIALNPVSNNSIICSTYIHLDLAGVSMPAIQIKGELSDYQVDKIKEMLASNINSSKYKFARIVRHFRRKISKFLNSKTLRDKELAWLSDRLNTDKSFSDSPRSIVEQRFNKRMIAVINKAQPGLKYISYYTNYVDSVFLRL